MGSIKGYSTASGKAEERAPENEAETDSFIPEHKRRILLEHLTPLGFSKTIDEISAPGEDWLLCHRWREFRS